MRALLVALLMATSASAGENWDWLAGELWPDRAFAPAGELIEMRAPYRTSEDARTWVGAQATAPEGDRLTKITVILDENPMPVSTVIELAEPLPRLAFETTLRINGPTGLHIVVETEAGGLFMAESFVKTSGQGACAAPPGTDPIAALETLGQMELQMAGESLLSPVARLEALGKGAGQSELHVSVRHPSHSGMQRDQVSLLYIPMRYVGDLDIALDGAAYASVTGSISLSENPELRLSVPASTSEAEVTMTDTDGTITRAKRNFRAY